MPLILILVLLAFPQLASAYPEFIGYKYASCLTCHFNGHGNGPLNDYGRALWAAEIAGKAFASDKTDEQLGEASGLFGSRQLPWWLRPGFKARELVYQPNPPSSGAKTRYITMQADANLALIFNREQKYIFVGSFGYVPQPQRLQTPGSEKVPEWISREHYFRMLSGESLWLYFGFLDKVYGIRNVNHTAYSRKNLGLAQNDQSHGIVVHYIQPTWEFTVNAFGGNLYQEADVRQMGASITYEQELKEAFRIGTSLLYSTNKYIGNSRLGVFGRYGFGYGAALLAEVGLLQDKPKSGDAKNGYYLFSEATQRVVRGVHVFMGAQMFKDRMQGNRPDKLKTSAGFIVWPRQRFEWRFELENGRQFTDDTEVQKESWLVLSQLHIAL